MLEKQISVFPVAKNKHNVESITLSLLLNYIDAPLGAYLKADLNNGNAYIRQITKNTTEEEFNSLQPTKSQINKILNDICEDYDLKLIKPTLEVIFRKYPKGDVIALFPYEIENHKGEILSYMHVGQHSSADRVHVMANTTPAKQEDYMPLYNELQGIYEDHILKPIKLTNIKKYSKALKEFWDKK
jgi:hypothetical protein